MLTWGNFKYVFVEDAAIPWFPVNGEIKDSCNVEEVLEAIDRMYLATLNAFVYEAVNNNAYYAPNGTALGSDKVWSKPCKKNTLTLHKGYLGGNLASFRAADDIVVELVTKLPNNFKGKEYQNYKGHFWYTVNGDLVECQLYAAISPTTDQPKLGKE